MRIVVIGGTGTIGKAVVEELKPRHEVIVAGHSHGDIQVDVSDKDSIEALFQSIEKIDAVVLTTGKVHFGDFMEMNDPEYQIGLQNKLMGQVNVVLIGRHHINDNGSFTLTSGITNYDPIRFGSSVAMVNGAIDGFVKGGAIEMPRSVRLNCVSPTVIEESMEEYADYYRGFKAVPAAEAALSYSKSVEGLQTGQIYKAGF